MLENENKKKILLAEDEKPMAKALEAKLNHSGFAVTVANDGNEAIQRITEQKFDLILLDLIMPQKDGFAVLEELKAMGNQTPVIILSNLGQAEDMEKAKQLGAKDFFIKSNTPIVTILENIKKWL